MNKGFDRLWIPRWGYQRGVVSALLVLGLVGSLTIAGQVTPVLGDILTNFNLYEGGCFSNGTCLFMPEANVSYHIENHDSAACIDINVTGSFIVYSNVTQNATLAFMYPSGDHSFGYQLWTEMELQIDGRQLEYERYNSSEVEWTTLPYDPLGLLFYAEYAVFKVELEAFMPITILVNSWISGCIPANYLYVDYYFTSAKTFNSDTHQQITATIIENEPFVASSFYPSLQQTTTHDGSTTTTSWDFYVSDMLREGINMINMIFFIKEGIHWPSQTTSTTSTISTNQSASTGIELSLAAWGSAAIIVLAAVFIEGVGFEKYK